MQELDLSCVAPNRDVVHKAIELFLRHLIIEFLNRGYEIVCPHYNNFPLIAITNSDLIRDRSPGLSIRAPVAKTFFDGLCELGEHLQFALI